MRLIPTYRPRTTPLHSARAGVSASLLGAFVLAALLFSNPVLLAAVVGGLVLLAAGAGVVADLRRGALLAVPVAIVIVVVNALVYREGAHVIFRGGVILGRRIDITLESAAAGGRTRWSRHDVRVVSAAALVAGIAIAARLIGANGFHAYPTISLALGPRELLVAVALLVAGASPAAGRSARLGVAHG